MSDEKAPHNENMTTINTDELFNFTSKFAVINKLITKDLNRRQYLNPSFYHFTREQIAKFLKDPAKHHRRLRKAVIYIYNASSHFRRLIQYFVGLTDLSYVITPYRMDTTKVNPATVKRNYHKVLNTLESFDIRGQFPKILTVVLREDVYFGTIRETDNGIIIQQLPSDFCYISSIEGNVFNVSFDFQYFVANEDRLDFFPEEFTERYKAWKDGKAKRWQELDAPNSFAIKANSDIPDYPVPPFSGVLRDIYDIEDYRDLKMAKTALENYAMVVMKLGISDDGDWTLPLTKAREFWGNLNGVLPDEVGSILSPMPLEKISFERSNTSDVDTVAEAEQNMYSAAGVSSLLFNNTKASANALLLSIMSDQAITYGIVKSLATMLNRYLHSFGFGKYFQIEFLDCSPFNRKELGDMYLKACQYGVPMVSYYCASQGLMQSEMEGMNFLENDILKIKDTFIPLKSATQMSSEDTDDVGGAPEKDIDELSEEGEKWRENQ